MSKMYYVNATTLNAMAAQHQIALQALVETQQQLINAQREIISLQKKLDKQKPKKAKDAEVIWHIASGGVSSMSAATSNDLDTVRAFMAFNTSLAEKHIKPYVDPTVYMECHNQMTRGLPERMAALQTREDLLFIQDGKLPAGNGGNGMSLSRLLLKSGR